MKKGPGTILTAPAPVSLLDGPPFWKLLCFPGHPGVCGCRQSARPHAWIAASSLQGRLSPHASGNWDPVGRRCLASKDRWDSARSAGPEGASPHCRPRPCPDLWAWCCRPRAENIRQRTPQPPAHGTDRHSSPQPGAEGGGPSRPGSCPRGSSSLWGSRTCPEHCPDD